MRPPLRVVVAVVAGASACGFPGYAFEGTGPADAGDAGDASAPLGDGDASVRDAATETAASDSTSSDSAALDTIAPDTRALDTATVDVSADTSPDAPVGCAVSTAVFCRDFDSVGTPESGWSGTFVTGGGALALDSVGLSPPSSLLSTLPNTTAIESGATVYDARDAPSASSVTRVDVDLLFDSGSYPAELLFLKLQRPGLGKGVGVGLYSGGLYVEVLGAGPSTSFRLATPAPVGRWFHLRLEAQLMVAGASLRLFVDDLTTPVLDRSGLSSADVDGTRQQLDVGLYTNATPITSFQVHYDDVQLAYP